MLQAERHKIILQQLEAKGNVTVSELRELLQVSTDTVRRDLTYLSGLKKLDKVHGGAVSKRDSVTNQEFTKRKVKFIERKQEIAAIATRFISEKNAISLNAGTTNIEVAKQLVTQFEQLTVITNSLKIADVLSSNRGFTVILPGGILNHEEFSLYDQSIGERIAQYNIDYAFISVNAISLEKGLTDFRLGEADVINAMIKNAGKTIAVADSSKFETVSYLNICELDELYAIVTDSEIDKSLQKKYERHNVKIINS